MIVYLYRNLLSFMSLSSVIFCFIETRTLATPIAAVRVEYVETEWLHPNTNNFRVKYCSDLNCEHGVDASEEQRLGAVHKIFGALAQSYRKRVEEYFHVSEARVFRTDLPTVERLLREDVSEESGGCSAWSDAEWSEYLGAYSPETTRLAIMEWKGGATGTAAVSYVMTFDGRTGQLLLTEHIQVSE